MKRLYLYLILIIFIPVVAVIPFFHSVNSRVLDKKRLSALDYAINNKDYNDIIFIGSSRARQHIDPLLIDSVIHLLSYNVSIDAAGVVQCNLLLNEYLQHHPRPKFVFLNIDLNMFDVSTWQPFTTDYFNYLKDTIAHRCLSPYSIAYRSSAARVYYKFLKYFSVTDMDKNNFFFPAKSEQKVLSVSDYRGFGIQNMKWDEKRRMKNSITYSYDQGGFNLLKDMVEKCRKDSIGVIFIYSPFYAPVKPLIVNYQLIQHKVEEFSRQSNIPFWDYSTMPICDSAVYFESYNHLNYKGARVYSSKLALNIKSKLLGGQQ